MKHSTALIRRETGAWMPRPWGALLQHSGMALLVVGHLLVALAVSLAVGRPYEFQIFAQATTFLTLFTPLFLVVLLIGRFCWMAAIVRPESPMRWLAADVRQIAFDRERLAAGVAAITLLLIFMGTFAYLKAVIPAVQPFAWDAAFADWDRALHFGRHAYVWLLPLLRSPLAVSVVNFIYHLWFFLLFFVTFVAAFSVGRQEDRMTFFYAFFLTWSIGGNLLATIFSSAGPVYFERLGFGDAFRPLMDHLHAAGAVAPVWALQVQEMLWESYLLQENSFRGISAMPSMHVASSVLLALYGFRLSRTIGLLLSVFAACILLGSVLLGWHYAIDGYAGIAIALLCWAAARRLARLEIARRSGQRGEPA